MLAPDPQPMSKDIVKAQSMREIKDAVSESAAKCIREATERAKREESERAKKRVGKS